MRRTSRAATIAVTAALAMGLLVAPAQAAPPVAVDDAYGVTDGGTLTVSPQAGVLANDSDPDEDSLTVSVVTPPSGSLTLNANGSFGYTHPGDLLWDQFTYEVSDGAETAQATVTIAPCFGPLHALANPGFETDTLEGWCFADLADPFYPVNIAMDGDPRDPGESIIPGTVDSSDGVFSLMSGFDGGGPGTVEVFRDIVLPPARTLDADVSIDVLAAYDLTFGATEDRTIELVVEPAGGGAALHTDELVRAEAATTGDSGVVTGTVDLAQFDLDAVRLKVVMTIPENYTGPAYAMVDNLQVLPASVDTSVGLFGSDNEGRIFEIDPTTGAAALTGIVPPGFTEIECNPDADLAVPDCFGQFPDGEFAGRAIDPYAGVATGPVVGNGGSFNGLEYIGGALYGTYIAGPGGPSTLATLDPATGDVADIGLTGVGPLAGLAHDPESGTTYAVAGGPGPAELYTIDLATGVATSVGSTGIQSGSLQFGPDGRLFAGGTGATDGGNLFEVDPATAATTLVGPTGFDRVTGLTTFGNPPPVVTDTSGTIAEGAEVGTAVAMVTATDPDGGPLTLEITGGNDDGAFAIDASGEVTVAGPTTAGVRTLTVAATDDEVPPLTGTGTVTVTITDVEPVIAAFDISDQSPDVGATLDVTVTVSEGITPTVGARVGFAIDGANAGAGPRDASVASVFADATADTAADGTARFSYTGGNAGTDTLTVFLDDDADGVLDDNEASETASVVWVGAQDVQRLFGADRLSTAIAVSQQSYPAGESAHAVVLARADQFPDGLAGTPFAYAVDGPLLLSATDGLRDDVAAEIDRVLQAGGTVHLLGGPAALSEDVATALTDLGYEVDRIFGADRYGTAVAIAERLPDATTAFVTRGADFPDALAAGPAAISADGIILLSNETTAHPQTSAYLDANPGLDVYAVGGQAATAHPAATPLFGVDRFATATTVADEFFDDATVVGIARSHVFADSLTGGVHIGRLGGPLLLTRTESLDTATAAWLTERATSLTRAYVYGGPAAVADSTASAVGGTID